MEWPLFDTEPTYLDERPDLTDDDVHALEVLDLAKDLFAEAYERTCTASPPWWENLPTGTQRFWLHRAERRLQSFD